MSSALVHVTGGVMLLLVAGCADARLPTGPVVPASQAPTSLVLQAELTLHELHIRICLAPDQERTRQQADA